MSNPVKENWKRTALRGIDPSATDPNLLERYIAYISKTVRQDEGTKQLVFFTILSAFTPNPINLFLKGESSIGKTYNAVQSLQFFSEDAEKAHIWLLGGLSPTALIHSKAEFIDTRGYLVDWNDKPTRQSVRQELRDTHQGTDTKIDSKMVEERLREAKKQWDLRIAEGHYEVDLTNKILVFLDAPHLETFNKLRPILSHDAEEISYRFTDKTGRGKLQTTHVKIKGFPATIFCSSEETFIRDLATRSFNITPETSPEKLRCALDVLAEKKVNPWRFDKDEEWVRLEAYLHWWMHEVKNYGCLIPYARELKQVFPLYATRVMRDFDHFLTLIEVVALFRFVQRPVLERNGEKYILATFEDFNTIMRILPSFEESTVSGLPGHVLACFHQAMMPLFEEVGDFDYAQLTDKYNEVFKEKRSSKTLYNWVRLLAEIGWITTYRQEEDKRRSLIKIIKNGGETLYSSLRRFPSLFSQERFKNVIKEWENYSPKKVILKSTILDNHSSSIDAIYKTHFQGEYFFEEEKPETEPKTEKKPENIPREQSRQSPETNKKDEVFTAFQCCDCRKVLGKHTPYTFEGGKPFCFPCLNKLKAQQKILVEAGQQ